ncbi:MAG: efflux RND transporter periplasmic adaptor subunit [Thiohalospira sp.]
MHRPSALYIAALALVGLLLTAVLSPVHAQQDKQDKKEDQPPPEVGVVEIQPRDVERTTELPGRTAAYQVADIRPQVTGVLRERRFEAGDRVEKGQTLYEIDPRRYEAAVERAEAALLQAQARVENLRRKEERYADLVAEDSVSQQEYDDVRASLREQEAAVQVTRAELATARLDREYASIEAPIRGRVSEPFITVGELVTANQGEALTRVTRLDPIYVDVQRGAKEVLRLQRAQRRGELETGEDGQPRVEVELPDGSSHDHAGRLSFSGVNVDGGTGTVTLRATVPNPDGTLLPGMFVRARVSEGTEAGALLVPQQGVTRNRQGEPTALVVNDDDEVERRRLTVDRTHDSFWVVTDGLAAGDRVMVSGLQKADPGDTVKPVEADIPNQPAEDAAEGDDHG